jgi:GNAT superfamily N-acetyltransferase
MTTTATWAITPVPAPATLDDPDAWALHGAAAVSHAVDLDHYGHTDIAYSARYLLARLHEQTYARRTWLVATEPEGVGRADAVRGLAMVVLPAQGNDHAAFVDVLVHPEHRGHGIGSALVEIGERLAREAGRTTVISGSEHPGEPPADDPMALEAPTGSGRIRADDPSVRFALARGYAFGQAERYSMLELPVDPALLSRLHDDAAAHAGRGYRLVTWQDVTPDAWVDHLALLETRMTTDPPNGEIDYREEPWDAARVRAYEAQRAEGGHGYAVVAAEHLASGALAGFTMLEYPWDEPEVLFQEDTIVLEEHRGHRLGTWMKVAMLQQIGDLRPGARRVHTWNAEENEHMLGINVALGFRPQAVGAVWQKTLAL